MQLQFHKMACPCLQPVKREVRNQEQTQEIRLEDGMPDIGRVLGAWGQVLLRSKEWRTGTMSVSGGVMVWVLYVPEEGGSVQWVDTWLPFQMKWDLPDTQHDGRICTKCLLRSVDARSTSARKLMVRASVGVLGQAWLNGEFNQYVPQELPEDVQVLKNTYPFHLPQETGEKAFVLDEILTLPESAPKMEKLIYYMLQPEIVDKKVMGSKVVFRGNAKVTTVYQAENGMLHSWEYQLPFSQYGELEGDYDPDANAHITMEVTSLELEHSPEGNLNLRSGLLCQYVISDRNMVTVVEDAYSPRRTVGVQKELQQIPMILEQLTQNVHAETKIEQDTSRIVDAAFYPDHPRVLHREGGIEAEIPAQFTMLYYDEEGIIQSQNAHWSGSVSLSAAPEIQADAQICSWDTVQTQPGSGQTGLYTELTMHTTGCAEKGMPVVTALELGELSQPDPGRPSLVLRRMGNKTLWETAKQTGSTVEAICQANHLTDDPDPHQLLLIPIP